MTTPTTDPTPPTPPASGPEAPSPDGHDGPSEFAQRVGPWIVVGSLVVTVAVLLVGVVLPSNAYPTVAEAGITVPATLLVDADEDGCFRVVDGDGTSAEYCDEDWRWSQTVWDDDGNVLISTYGPFEDELREAEEVEAPLPDEFLRLTTIDPATGTVLDVEELRGEERFTRVPEQPAANAGLIDGRDVVVDGDAVLTVDGPWGLRLDEAIVSPSGDWVGVRDSAGRVLFARTDGTAGPVRLDVDDRWIWLSGAVRWDDSA